MVEVIATVVKLGDFDTLRRISIKANGKCKRCVMKNLPVKAPGKPACKKRNDEVTAALSCSRNLHIPITEPTQGALARALKPGWCRDNSDAWPKQSESLTPGPRLLLGSIAR